MLIAKRTKSQVDASVACSSTIRKHAKEVEYFIGIGSQFSEKTLKIMKEKLFRRMPKTDRQDILEKLKLLKPMNAEDGLAMLADLSITWYTYRSWGRLVILFISYPDMSFQSHLPVKLHRPHYMSSTY